MLENRDFKRILFLLFVGKCKTLTFFNPRYLIRKLGGLLNVVDSMKLIIFLYVFNILIQFQECVSFLVYKLCRLRLCVEDRVSI